MKSSSSAGPRVIRSPRLAAQPLALGQGPEERQVFSLYPGAAAARPTAERVSHEQAVASARRQGFEAGRAEARAECDAETEGLRTTLELVVRELWQSREALYREAEADVVRLALEVARRVVGELAER